MNKGAEHSKAENRAGMNARTTPMRKKVDP